MGGVEAILVNDDIPSTMFPLTLTVEQLNGLENMPRPLTGAGDEEIFVFFFDENSNELARRSQIFRFND
jgi:hypothetical protein